MVEEKNQDEAGCKADYEARCEPVYVILNAEDKDINFLNARMNNYLILFARNNCMVQRYRILSACDAFPYTIKFECAAGECAANLQSVNKTSCISALLHVLLLYKRGN